MAFEPPADLSRRSPICHGVAQRAKTEGRSRANEQESAEIAKDG